MYDASPMGRIDTTSMFADSNVGPTALLGAVVALVVIVVAVYLLAVVVGRGFRRGRDR